MAKHIMRAVRDTSPASGFLLIETMVATLVLSIALIGLAAMQLTSIKNNHSAMLRGESAIHIANMANRMRANIQGIKDGNYNITYRKAPTPPSGTVTPAAFRAQQDLIAWLAEINAALPNATNATSATGGSSNSTEGQIACTGATCAISVRWSDSRGLGVAADGNYTLTTNVLF